MLPGRGGPAIIGRLRTSTRCEGPGIVDVGGDGGALEDSPGPEILVLLGGGLLTGGGTGALEDPDDRLVLYPC